MFNFRREKILPLFLQKSITIAKFARKAGLSHKAAFRAVNGLSVTAPVVEKIARALNINPLLFLENSGR